MKNNTNTFDACLLSIGTVYSLANIEQILGVIILIIQLVWILAKLGVKIFNAIKEKTPEKQIEETIESTVDDIQEAIDFFGNGKTDG